jgi:hypothetical protein
MLHCCNCKNCILQQNMTRNFSQRYFLARIKNFEFLEICLRDKRDAYQGNRETSKPFFSASADNCLFEMFRASFVPLCAALFLVLDNHSSSSAFYQIALQTNIPLVTVVDGRPYKRRCGQFSLIRVLTHTPAICVRRIEKVLPVLL